VLTSVGCLLREALDQNAYFGSLEGRTGERQAVEELIVPRGIFSTGPY
jgi:hypothetical protein